LAFALNALKCSWHNKGCTLREKGWESRGKWEKWGALVPSSCTCRVALFRRSIRFSCQLLLCAQVGQKLWFAATAPVSQIYFILFFRQDNE